MQSWRFYREKRALDPALQASINDNNHPDLRSAGQNGECGLIDFTSGQDAGADFIVALEGQENPQHWSLRKKMSVLAGLSLIASVVTFSSTVLAPSYPDISRDFACAEQVSYLGNSLYLTGFGLGAILMAPLSEMFGRQPVYTGGLLAFSMFQLGAATAGHWWTLAIWFFAGLFGSPPLSNGGGSLADMFSPVTRTWSFPIFALFGFLPPTIGPTMGAFITSSAGGWRWSMWLCCFLGLFTAGIGFLAMPETYAPALHELKAASLNSQYGTQEFKSPRFARTGRKATFDWHILLRALQMLVTEPIIFLMTLYLTVVYFVLYSDLESYALIYAQWDFTTNQTGLTFLALAIGVILAGSTTPLVYNDYMIRRERINQDGKSDRAAQPVNPPPEARLIQLCWASWLLPISMFWLGFTTFPSISPWPSIVAGIPFGGGLLFTFISSYEYIIDAYGPASASALAGTTFVRYIACAGLIHATKPMYTQMTFRGGFSLLGGVSLALCCVPFALIRYGRQIRARSEFAPPVENEPALGPFFVRLGSHATA